MKKASVARATSESPADNAYAITPHDTNEIGTYEPKALYVGGAGNITMKLTGDTASVLFAGVPAGTVLPVKPRIILSTGTTATNLVALY